MVGFCSLYMAPLFHFYLLPLSIFITKKKKVKSVCYCLACDTKAFSLNICNFRNVAIKKKHIFLMKAYIGKAKDLRLASEFRDTLVE